MKQVPIKTQKTIMYIPYINILNVFFWLFNSCHMDIKYNGVPQTFVIVALSSVPLVVLQTIFSNLIPIVGDILGYINVYIIPLFISSGLIKYQEKLLNINGRSE